MSQIRQNGSLDTVTLYICPTCGEQKPRAWGETETDCFGEWKSNSPDENGRTTDHDPAPFKRIVYKEAS